MIYTQIQVIKMKSINQIRPLLLICFWISLIEGERNSEDILKKNKKVIFTQYFSTTKTPTTKYNSTTTSFKTYNFVSSTKTIINYTFLQPFHLQNFKTTSPQFRLSVSTRYLQNQTNESLKKLNNSQAANNLIIAKMAGERDGFSFNNTQGKSNLESIKRRAILKDIDKHQRQNVLAITRRNDLHAEEDALKRGNKKMAHTRITNPAVINVFVAAIKETQQQIFTLTTNATTIITTTSSPISTILNNTNILSIINSITTTTTTTKTTSKTTTTIVSTTTTTVSTTTTTVKTITNDISIPTTTHSPINAITKDNLESLKALTTTIISNTTSYSTNLSTNSITSRKTSTITNPTTMTTKVTTISSTQILSSFTANPISIFPATTHPIKITNTTALSNNAIYFEAINVANSNRDYSDLNIEAINSNETNAKTTNKSNKITSTKNSSHISKRRLLLLNARVEPKNNALNNCLENQRALPDHSKQLSPVLNQDSTVNSSNLYLSQNSTTHHTEVVLEKTMSLKKEEKTRKAINRFVKQNTEVKRLKTRFSRINKVRCY